MTDNLKMRGSYAHGFCFRGCPGCPACSQMRDDLFDCAWRRVRHSKTLLQYWSIIMSDGYADADHLRWVCRGTVKEIAAWAEQIRRDSNDDSDN